MAGVGISVVHRETATGDVHGDSVSGQEYVACRQQLDLIGKNLAGFQQLRRIVDSVPEPSADNPVGQVSRNSVRLHIDQPHQKISVGCRSRSVDRGSDRPCHLKVFFKHRRLEHQTNSFCCQFAAGWCNTRRYPVTANDKCQVRNNTNRHSTDGRRTTFNPQVVGSNYPS